MSLKRVVSLLPSATEILALIGGSKMLVGRSHECDYPANLGHLPVVTASKLSFTTSSQVDTQVREAMASGDELYTLDGALLKELKPDIILTQNICSVCSIDTSSVARIVNKLSPPPLIVELNPGNLQDVLDDIIKVGKAVGLEEEAKKVEQGLQQRISDAVNRAASANLAREQANLPRPNVAFLEWADPVYVGGHWTPQLIEMAGGLHPLNPPKSKTEGGDDGGGKSFAVSSAAVTASDPDIVILSPCGLDLEATEKEAWLLYEQDAPSDWFANLRAVREGRVVCVDGNQMFNRPGPRLVAALEWLVALLHHDGPASTLSLQGAPVEASFPWKPLDLAPSARPSSLPPKAPPAVKTPPKIGGCAGPVGGFPPDIEEAHRCAIDCGEDMYTDPATGYMVFTEEAQRKRGVCCGRGCRHCPYGHWNVQRSESRKNVVQRPTMLPPAPKRDAANNRAPVEPLEVFFWSGGKDSFLALLARQRAWAEEKLKRQVCLVTTFDPTTGAVPEQSISVSRIMDQARAIGEKLLIIPLPQACPNETYVATIQAALTQELLPTFGIANLSDVTFVFGDLHLKDIKAWREEHMGGLGVNCMFPLFQQPYSDLAEELTCSPYKVTISVSAVNGKGQGVVAVGEKFDKELVERLTKEGKIDPFGENGEFHTQVEFGKMQKC